MARQNINVGNTANDGTGDPLRTGMVKINDNFTELYTNAPISNTVTVGNTTVNTYINSTSISTKNITLSGDLSVTGNVSFQGETLFSNTINITTTDKLLVLANGTATAAAANNSGIVINTFANLLYVATASGWQSNVNFVPSSNNLLLGNTTSIWNLYANTINAVSISTSSNTVTFGTSVYFTSNGNVGFSNNSPSHKVSINGDFYVGNTTVFGFVNATSYYVSNDFIANTAGLFLTGVVNSSVAYIGSSNVVANSSGIYSSKLDVASSLIVNSSSIVVSNSITFYANGGVGTLGQFLTSNGTGVYWSNIIPSTTVDQTGQYYWSNTHSFSGEVSFSNTVNITNSILINGYISANGSNGVPGQILASANSGNVYWRNIEINLNSNTTSSDNFYILTGNSTTGTWSNAVISPSFYFIPSSGTLNVTTINSLSDENKKENIRKINDAIEILNKINGVRFDWKNNKNPSAGLIAQEVEQVMPELVLTNPDTGEKSLNYSGIIAVLVEAVKHLMNKG